MKASEMFGENVFGIAVMRDKLPKDVYKSLVGTIEDGTPLDPGVASVVANAMKDWAVEKGATHFTHWFQPMTGITAEKHDSFVSPGRDGKAIMEFSGKELVMGEPDASSFPSGGVRATFEARGYTAWDPTSFAFVKDGTLYVPSAFFSYSGEVLDKKTPLLKSMKALSREALRILKLFGTEAKQVFSTVGAEQEYFLIDKKDYLRRKDLVYTGRTLFGARPPKGQEMEDHYFGAIKSRVFDFMKELDEELWKLGIFAKTEHNEVAPAQHELAPLFASSNLANDQNQLIMEMMKRIADKRGLACLLHEKPFAGINGSGKHNNWSMSTDRGVNLLDPGSTPAENSRFLLFFSAVIAAVDEYQDLLRLSVAGAGNDHRLGANEAPPAIVSVYVGEELGEVLDALERDEKYAGKKRGVMKLGVDTLPDLPKDTTDRNRTSPFAFTGNKFEFRMVGSSFSLAGPNIVINTIVADVLKRFADVLEKADDFNSAVHDLVVKTVREHKRIIFNGNSYSDEWKREAKRRGLSDLADTSEALPLFAGEKSVDLFERMGVMSKREVVTRTEIMLDNYCKSVAIEGLTAVEMVRRDIYPAVLNYVRTLCDAVAAKKILPGANHATEEALATELSELTDGMCAKAEELSQALAEAKNVQGAAEQSAFYAHKVLPLMHEMRVIVDCAEMKTPKEMWPYPTYGELLFGV